MPKQGEKRSWDYFKISNKDVSIAFCILPKNNLSKGSKDPHKMTTTTNLCRSQSCGLGEVASEKFWFRHIPTKYLFKKFSCFLLQRLFELYKNYQSRSNKIINITGPKIIIITHFQIFTL